MKAITQEAKEETNRAEREQENTQGNKNEGILENFCGFAQTDWMNKEEANMLRRNERKQLHNKQHRDLSVRDTCYGNQQSNSAAPTEANYGIRLRSLPGIPELGLIHAPLSDEKNTNCNTQRVEMAKNKRQSLSDTRKTKQPSKTQVRNGSGYGTTQSQSAKRIPYCLPGPLTAVWP